MRSFFCAPFFTSIAAVSILLDDPRNVNVEEEMVQYCFPRTVYYVTRDETIWLTINGENSTTTKKCIKALRYFILKSDIEPNETRIIVTTGKSFHAKHFRIVEVDLHANETNGITVIIHTSDDDDDIRGTKRKPPKGMKTWHLVTIGIAVLIVFALALFGARFMLIHLRRRTQNSGSNRQEVGIATERSCGKSYNDCESFISQVSSSVALMTS
ncbi:hypothetical protein Tcan_18289 [Toxocara canis]|uniref:Uncharacterized protein n=1 Tax=Toxocara canis TaxID=6265 RepID=A0A0B2VG88_TOXCA|nr:hypothetical protein Tcan_18289 [Toxocara canis]